MDLRLSGLDGKVIKVDDQVITNKGIVHKARKFIITKVYPYHVVAEAECENGYLIRSSFNVGDLITKGIIKQIGR